MNLDNALIKANKFLLKNKIKSPLLDSEILMSKVMNKDRKFIISNLDLEIDKNALKYFEKLIFQRASGKPISYITETKNFWKYRFQITEGVLIPRPDTEIIIEEILKITKFKRKLRILDIGIGSGCILLSVLKERIDFYGTGIDISKKCIKISN